MTLRDKMVDLRARAATTYPPIVPKVDQMIALYDGASAPSLTVLGAAAAALQPGQWGKLPASENMRAVLNSESGASGTVIGFAEVMDWDEATQSLYFLGSDHGAKAKFVTYRAATDTWHVEPDAPWYKDWQPVAGWPQADHGYRHQVVEPGVAFYRRPQGMNQARRTLWRYDFATKAWAQIPPYPVALIDYLSVAIGLAYFPERKSIVIVSAGAPYNVAEYEIATQTWRALHSMPTLVGSYHNSIQYNPVHKCLLIAGGVNVPRVMHKVAANGVVTRLADAPAALELGVNRAVITVDPVGGDFLVLYGASFYAYDIVADAWRALPSPPTRLPHPTATAFGTVAAPIASLGVTVWPMCTRAKGPAALHIYKHG